MCAVTALRAAACFPADMPNLQQITDICPFIFCADCRFREVTTNSQARYADEKGAREHLALLPQSSPHCVRGAAPDHHGFSARLLGPRSSYRGGRFPLLVPAFALVLLGAFLLAPAAQAEPPRVKAQRSAPARGKKGKPAVAPAPAPEAATPETPAPRAAGEGETQLKGGPDDSSAKSVKEKESAEGVKTYQFGAIEVEGRLRSPQLIYFLRRVRAEFQAGALGHRSFLGELAHTQNDPAFR